MTGTTAIFETVDYHTAGEPFRIVIGGVETPNGKTVLERRTWAQANLDDVRALLINEPRGHADMYGCFVTPSDDADGDIGVVFFHKDGFSTACGHGTIALVTWAIESGRIEFKPGETVVPVVVDAPSGRLRTEATLRPDGSVQRVGFRNVPAFVSKTSALVSTQHGELRLDVAFGGAFYGSVDLAQTDLKPQGSDLTELISLGREIKRAFVNHAAVRHPTEPRLSGMYGVIFFDDADINHPSVPAPAVRQRNVTVFADGEVDRSPCGSGTSARLALLHHHGELQPGETFLNQGIANGVFVGRVESVSYPNENRAQRPVGPTLVHTWVSGAAFRTGTSRFERSPNDDLGLGFQLR